MLSKKYFITKLTVMYRWILECVCGRLQCLLHLLFDAPEFSPTSSPGTLSLFERKDGRYFLS